MNSRTQKLTFGAMIVAIYGVLLLLNRQTGNMFADLFMFIFPIPMVAYSAKYGLKDSLPVLVCTVLMSVFYGTFNILFYSISESIIGTVYGTCLYHKKSAGRTMLLVMALSAIANVLSSVVLLSFYGMNLTTEITAMQTEMTGVFTQSGVLNQPGMEESISQLLTYDYMLRMYVIAMVLMGILQGFVIYQLSLVLLRKLKYPIQKPQPIESLFPPAWTGYVALIAFLLYYFSMMVQWNNEHIKNAFMSAGMCGYLYLVAFGVIGAGLFFKTKKQFPKVIAVVLVLLSMFSFPYILLIVGYLYLSGDLHRKLLSALEEQTQK